MTRSALTMSARALLTLLGLCSAPLLLTACGGGSGSSSDAKSPGGEDRASGDSSSSDSASTSSSDGAAPEGPTRPDCSDGTCFECGEGICPKGAYCDQNAEGGAACAWLPECSGTAACGCIQDVLKGCSCDDTSGGPIVSCQ